MYYLVLMKVPEVLKGLAVNTTNRQSPERPITSLRFLLLHLPVSLRKCSLRGNTIKTTLRVKTQHFLKKRKKSNQMPVTLE